MDGVRCYKKILQPANMRYAAKFVAEIKRQIDAGTFDYAQTFPESQRAGPGTAARTLGAYGDLWLKSKGRHASATKSQNGTMGTFSRTR